jgi:2-polyprenyl-3-methyl-5-hydroxy-6-metoxy-1,4-benzoquinol methylase
MSEMKGEPQYREIIRTLKQRGGERLGYMSSWTYISDPKRLVFLLARYKFVAKMMDGLDDILEVGCADAFGTRIVAQATGHVTAIDFDPDFVESAQEAISAEWPVTVQCHDILDEPVDGEFDGVYSLDVLEHIPARDERRYVANMIAPLRPNGVAIVGSPSLESQDHASEPSREGHVNCKTQADLRALMAEFFQNVFIFSMNDEVVHTGFHALSHYNLALCCGKRPEPSLGSER